MDSKPVREYIDFQEAFSKTFAEMSEAGEQYAQARAVSWQLQEQKKVLLAELALQSSGSSVAEKEKMALVHPSYKLHLDGTSAAIHQELSLKAKYETCFAKYEAYRSLCSFENAKSRIL